MTIERTYRECIRLAEEKLRKTLIESTQRYGEKIEAACTMPYSKAAQNMIEQTIREMDDQFKVARDRFRWNTASVCRWYEHELHLLHNRKIKKIRDSFQSNEQKIVEEIAAPYQYTIPDANP